MNKVPFSKSFLLYTDQLSQLKSRGLKVEDDTKAIHILEHISYYRLSGYWYPLLENKQTHTFKSNASFDLAFNIYCFDRKLRQLVLAELEKIEIAIRAKIIYILSENYGAFWFQNLAIFSNPIRHAETLSKLGLEYERSDEEFIKAFRHKYSDPLPPSWMITEISSFGTLSILYKNLKPIKEKRAIAHHFGLSDTVFETWLHSIVYLRNICAHHTRLWNRAMSIRPQIPKSPRKQWLIDTQIENNRTYYILSMILFLLQTVNPHHSFLTRFSDLCREYPMIDLNALGFSKNWSAEPLWRINK